ncbi:PTS sugar transporter subunit IIA, partial [Streptococcus pyogenes]
VDSGFRERTLEREKQESTIFGNGIGFPHTINQVGNKTILMLGVLDETHCEKGEVVDLIFLVAIPPKIEDKMETELLELYD